VADLRYQTVEPSGDHRLNDVRGIVTLSKAMLSTMTGFYDRMHIDRPDIVARTIFVDTLGVKATDFALSKETAELLFESGRRAATTFLDGDHEHPPWDFQEYKRRFLRASATPIAAGALGVSTMSGTAGYSPTPRANRSD
jgi:NTE family protein